MRLPADLLPAGIRRKKGEKADKKQMAAVDGTQAMLSLRTTFINGQWKDFQKYPGVGK